VDGACKVFRQMPERNEVSWTALVSGYMKYGKVDDGMEVFGRNLFQDVFSWTAVISGLLANGMGLRAIGVFKEMLGCGVMPNNVTFVSVVRRCGEMGEFVLGGSVLGLVVKVGFEDDISKDVISWMAILDMYVEMGDLEEARRVFDDMPNRNEVFWSAMISRYSQKGNSVEAIKLFRQMVENGIIPNSSCLSSAINTLANLKALHTRKNIHAHVMKIGMASDVYINYSVAVHC
ncbi:pentatricopeptide repeat-containing protein, partial [Tanacetum coccineum]